MDKIFIITRRFKEIFEKKHLSAYKLAKLLNYNDSSICQMYYGRKKFPDKLIEKIAPILEVSKDEVQGWIMADKYSKEILELAIKAKNEKHDSKLILTTKLDEILKSKDLSRTALSKIIKYSQGGLNEMLIGKEPMSKSVINKISVALEISENEIKSWILADKYSLITLEIAFNESRET